LELIPIKDIVQRRKQLDFEILKIKCHFQITKLQHIIAEIFEKYKPILKDGYSTYSGIGLQFSDLKNSIYDSVEQTSYISPLGNEVQYRAHCSYDFCEKNELAYRFSEVFDVFSDLNLYRGRILTAAPGHRHAEHTDGPRDCRIHIPIVTNPHSLMYFGKKSYHLAADGAAYLCNTSIPHHFVNLGNNERIHLVFVV
jgi:hypothetical protein